MVTPNPQQLEKSRLGRLLVNRGYITDAQLQQALEEQRLSGDKLGTVLVHAGWLTERELNRTLRHQNRYRYAAALTAMVVTPLQPVVALASPAPALPTATSQTASQQLGGQETGMEPLTEGEMDQVVAQGQETFLANAAALTATPESAGEAEDQALDALEFTARTFVPVMNFLDADVTVSGVAFGAEGPGFSIGEEGAVSLAMPHQIREIRMERIRVDGAPESASMGNLTVSNIQFSADSSLKIRPH
ncbi:MAG: pilus assembly protein PilB [Pseudomonadota bacterium]